MLDLCETAQTMSVVLRWCSIGQGSDKYVLVRQSSETEGFQLRNSSNVMSNVFSRLSQESPSTTV